MSSLRRRTAWTLVGFSFVLHVITVYCFARQPDRLAAFTVMPIWLWGGGGLLLSSLAFYFLRAPLSLVLTGVWAITLLVGADEARVLANLGKSAPEPGPATPHLKQPVIRVVSMNCNLFDLGSPIADLAAWKPDIVLLQDAHAPHVKQIAVALFGKNAHHRAHETNGVVSRWPIERDFRIAGHRQHIVTIQHPGRGRIEVANVHLSTAATDLRLWRREAWRDHHRNRAIRKRELATALAALSGHTDFPETPALFGGDFNAPATDPVHLQLDRHFSDAFAAAGTGWGNTYHRRLPVLRIDHIYASDHFIPVRARAAVTRHSDHRFVIADFILRR